MKRVLFIGLLFSLPFLQSCSCFLGWGYSGIKGGYFRYTKARDTVVYQQIMQQIGNRYPELLLRRDDPVLDSLKKYFTYIGVIKRLKDTSILSPIYPVKDFFGLSSWYIKSTNKDLVYVIGLYAGEMALSDIYIIKNNKVDKRVTAYNLCSLPSSERRRLRKYYIKRFEEEIIPLMKPYFEEYKKRKQ